MEQTVIRRLAILSMMALAVLAAASPAWAAEGDLDTSFSGDGKATTPVGVGGSEEGARDLALQPDGKTVVGGQAVGVGTGTDFALARYDADGDLDPSFGTGGRVLTDMGSQGRDEEVKAVALQPDGKIVVAGLTGRFSLPPNATDFAVARYNPNGTLDTSFSGDGRFTLDFGGTEEFASDLTVQSDGKIVVAGTVAPVGGGQPRDFALIRLNPNGILDTTFDTDGKVTTDIIDSSDNARAVTVQANGKIVAGGSAGTNFALARYNANGSLDNTFDTDGKVFTNVVASGDEQILDLAFAADSQPDKKIVVAGDMSNNFAVARYNADGSLDTNTDADPTTHFDTDGVQTTDFGSIDEAFGLVVAGDNKVTAAGLTFAGNDGIDFALARYTASGALDTQFSNDGKKVTDFGDTGDGAEGIALQTDGKAVVAGASGDRSSPGGRFALARYRTDGNLDSTFSFNGRVASVVSTGGEDVAEAVALQPDGKTVVAGRSPSPGGKGDAISVVRYNKNGSLDPSFGGDGKVVTELEVGSAGEAVAVQPDGKILVAGSIRSLAPRFGLVRYNPDGTLDETFSSDGIQSTGFGDDAGLAEAIALQPNGKILVAGTLFFGGDEDFALVRYNPNGSLDATFDGDGKATTPIGPGGDHARAMTLQGEKIAVAGFAQESADPSAEVDFAVARYNANGSLDNTFDGDGRVTTPVSVPGRPEDVQAVLAQPDGRIVVGGRADESGSFDNGFALVRYNTNGALDTNFSGDGILVDTGVDGTVRGLASQQGGRIVAAGGNFPGDFAVARYRPNGARDTTFGGDGVQTTDFFGSTEEARTVVVGPDSRITVAGSARNGDFNEEFAVARYVGDATPPDTAIISAPPALTRQTTAGFSFTSEPGAKFQCSLDAVAFAACASPKNLTGLSSARHTFRVRAVDRAGNVDPTPAIRAWTVDAVRPAATFLSPGATTPLRRPPITATVTDNRTDLAKANIELFLDGNPVTTFSYDRTTDRLSFTPGTNLSLGTHTARVEARDAAGNVRAAQRTFEVRP